MPEAPIEPTAPVPADQPDWIPVCAAADLADGGKGVRFPVLTPTGPHIGFVVRHAGRVHGWLNQCAHVPVELDWMEGQFFDDSRVYLICATHGALYEPDSGRCAGGPCRGGRLRPIRTAERDGQVWWQPDGFLRAPADGTGAARPP